MPTATDGPTVEQVAAEHVTEREAENPVLVPVEAAAAGPDEATISSIAGEYSPHRSVQCVAAETLKLACVPALRRKFEEARLAARWMRDWG